jgi:hypothetical protein
MIAESSIIRQEQSEGDKMIAETKHYQAIGKASLSSRPD